MVDQNPTEIIGEIMQELDKTGKYTEEETEKLMKDADQIQQERIKIRKAKEPTEKEKAKQKEKVDDEKFQKAVKDLPDEEWSNYEIEEELSKKRDLRKVLKVIAKNQPVMIRIVREMLNWKDNKRQHSYDMIDLLKEMGLVEEVEVLKIWAKDYAITELGLKSELTKEEEKVLTKFKVWTKSVKLKERNKFIGVSGYWKLTAKGKVCVLKVKKYGR